MSQKSTSHDDTRDKIGTLSLASLITGGMVGGGIYVALGVVVEAAGAWAWLSFVLAGIVALATARSYGALSNQFETGGGAFGFLEKMHRRGAAGSLSWLLLIAYTLTLALYGFAFGQYVSHAFGGGEWLTRGLSLGAIGLFTLINMRGVGDVKNVEVVIVLVNLAILLALGVWGVSDWSPDALRLDHHASKGIASSLMGAAAIFVSYEGFQLVTYEYDDIKNPKKILTPTLVVSSIVVIGIYVLVALGATMILGADAVIEAKTVVLATAASKQWGHIGLIVMTVAAAFATSAAINSTLFSTAKLAGRVADDGELPSWLDHRNGHDMPDHAVLLIAAGAALLSVIGSLSALVEAASLAFLIAFAVVNALALREKITHRWTAGVALALGGVIGAALVYRLATQHPIPLAIMVVLMIACMVLRPWILKKTTDGDQGHHASA